MEQIKTTDESNAATEIRSGIVKASTEMVLVDGIDGSLAASTQSLAAIGQTNALRASKMFGVIIVIFSFGLGGAELIVIELDRFILPLGVGLFAVVIGIRIWARSNVSTMIDAKAFNTGKLSE